MKITKLLAMMCFLPIALITEAAPLLPSSHPSKFCDLAVDLGYPSRGYKTATGGCASNQMPIGAEGLYEIENNLAFYVMGDFDDPTKLMRVSLILNVNNRKEEAAARAELRRVATALSRKITGAVPQGFEKAILNPTSKQWNAGDWMVEVKHTVWPKGRGYDLTIYFRPIGVGENGT
jgi:hypothetical protein